MIRLFKKARDPVSSFTHMLGAVLSFIGLIVMIIHMIKVPTNVLTIVSCVVFCLSLIALYCASGFYHYSNANQEVVNKLRKLDHAMIYVLIAGSYTPILLIIFDYPKWVLFGLAIWAVAFIGIIIKMCWMGAPRWLTSLIYILMGWAIMVDLPALKSMDKGAFSLLLAGGIFYTIGGVMYALKMPNFSKSFGFHETFHIMIMLGSLCHFLMVFKYVL